MLLTSYLLKAHLAAISGNHGVSSSEWLPTIQSQWGYRVASDGTTTSSWSNTQVITS